MFEFAEKVVSKLEIAWPESATDFIIRVDMFEVGGKLKLNEMESFEANYFGEIDSSSSRKRKRMDEVCSWSTYQTEIFLKAFWYKKLYYT